MTTSSSLIASTTGYSTNFYANLPSNTRVEGNTPARFRVRFARKLQFNSVWSVALAEISYPHSWPSLGTNEAQYVDVVWRQTAATTVHWTPNVEWTDAYERIQDRLLPTRTRIQVPRGRYPTAERIASMLASVIRTTADEASAQAETNARDAQLSHLRITFDEREQHEFHALIDAAHVRVEELRRLSHHLNFAYNAETQRFCIEFDEGVVERVELSQQLAYILGFEPTHVATTSSNVQASYAPDMLGGISELYVYAPGLIEPVIVGNVMAPLLRIVVVRGRADEIAHDTYVQPHYHKLLVKEVSEILIELRTSTGRLVPFEYGPCRLTLHFRKQPYF